MSDIAAGQEEFGTWFCTAYTHNCWHVTSDMWHLFRDGGGGGLGVEGGERGEEQINRVFSNQLWSCGM